MKTKQQIIEAIINFLYEQDKIEYEVSELDLSHLLRAIGDTVLFFPITKKKELRFCEAGGEMMYYNLEKTLAENLEDPVLCEFLYKLIVEK